MKILTKIQPKISRKVSGPWSFAGWLGDAVAGGTPIDPTLLIGEYYGEVSDDGSFLLSMTGNHTGFGQAKGSAFKGDGTNYGEVEGLLTTHTFTVGDGSGLPTCTTNGRLDIANGVYVWDLMIWDGGTLIADLPMICLGSGTEFSSTEGLPDCVWNPPVAAQLPSLPYVNPHNIDPGPFYEVFTDGTGSNRANEDGFSEYENLLERSIGPFNTAPWSLDNKTGLATVSATNVHLEDSSDLFRQLYTINFVAGTRYIVGIDATTTEGRLIEGRIYQSDFALDRRFDHLANNGMSYVYFTPNVTGAGSLYIQVPQGGPSVTFSINKCFVAVDTVSDTSIGKVAIIGDSLVSQGTGSALSYFLPESTIVDAGSSGNTLDHMAARFDADVIATSPDNVIIWGGINNIVSAVVSPVSNMMAKLAEMAEKCASNDIQLTVVTISPWGAHASNNTDRQSWTEEYNNLLSIYAETNGHRFVDVYSEWESLINSTHLEESISVLGDGLHPYSSDYYSSAAQIITIGYGREVLEYVTTTDQPITGRQPAAFTDPPQYPGPIAADMKLGGIGIQGDGTRYVDIPGLLTTDTIIGDATCTTNGRLDIADGTVCHSVTVERAGEEWTYLPMEDGQPGVAVSRVADVKGGNHGTLIDASPETAWVQTEVGPCYRMAGGFNLDKLGDDTGYTLSDYNNPGFDTDGDPLVFKANQYETFLNAGVLVQGSLGPETQALTSWTGEQWQDITLLPFNVDDQEFYCDEGMKLLREPASSEDIDAIGEKICSTYTGNLITNGFFFIDLSSWVAAQWEWQAPGRAAPIHTTSNTLQQTIDMDVGDDIIVRFDYHLEAGAALYVKLGNPSGINDIVINGPEDSTYIGVEVATGDTIQFAITGAATLDDWIDNVSVRLRVWQPDQFTFQDQSDVEPNTMTTSAPVTITGMPDDCPVIVTDGEYDVNQNDVWTSDPGRIEPGDLIRVRRLSADFGLLSSVTFQAGQTSDTFNILTTEAPDYLYDSDGNIMIDSDGNPVLAP